MAVNKNNSDSAKQSDHNPNTDTDAGRGLARAVVKVALVLLTVGVLLIAAVGYYAWHTWTSMPDPDEITEQTQMVRIQAGTTLSAAADSLVERGLLNPKRLFLLGAKLQKRDRALQTGLYKIPPRTSPRDLLGILTSGKTVQISFTLPEGLDAEEVADIVGQKLNLDAELFLALADSLVKEQASKHNLFSTPAEYEVFNALMTKNNPAGGRKFFWCEGFLAPDTYKFAEGVSAAQVAETLVNTQFARLDSTLSLLSATQRLDMSALEYLTLASLVEAEARNQLEQPLIAAVYTNRLNHGQRLEADPTIAYFLRKKGKRIYYKDLKKNSPYNTYQNRGLPPGPIGNPGLSAIIATCNPDTSCKAIFFVSDGQGGHVFSETATEHNRAVKRFREQRRQQR